MYVYSIKNVKHYVELIGKTLFRARVIRLFKNKASILVALLVTNFIQDKIIIWLFFLIERIFSFFACDKILKKFHITITQARIYICIECQSPDKKASKISKDWLINASINKFLTATSYVI